MQDHTNYLRSYMMFGLKNKILSTKIGTRLVVYIVVIALIPLIIFGTYAIVRAYSTAKQSVRTGNLRTAQQISGRIDQYLNNFEKILLTLVDTLNQSGMTYWQREKILGNFILNFKELHLIAIFDGNGKLTFSSPKSKSAIRYLSKDVLEDINQSKIYRSDVHLTQDFTPALSLAFPIKSLTSKPEILFAEIDLLHLWNLVEHLKIGLSGYASIVTKNGLLFATGSGKLKSLAIQQKPYPHFAELSHKNHCTIEIKNKNNTTSLFVSAKINSPLGWIVTIEQPTDEAYNLPLILKRDLLIIVISFLALALIAGWSIGRKAFLIPMGKLMDRIKEISNGQLEGSVEIKNQGEFSELADTLNDMSLKLILNQEQLVNKEREALIGKIASGLAHDLKHPITSIENHSKLLDRRFMDKNYRTLFKQTTT